jgi:ribonuclease R
MKKKIISFFKKHPGTAFRSKDIAKKLGITTEHEYSSLKACLYKLYEEDYLSRTGKRYKLNNIPTSNRLIGVLEINQAGYGFVIIKDSNSGDIFVSSRNLGTAFHHDTVEVSLFAKQKGKNLEGQVTGVVTRSRTEIVGTLQKSKAFYFVRPDDTKVHRDIYIDPENLRNAKPGDKITVGNIQWDNPNLNPEGEIIEVLGKAGSHDAEITSIAKEFNLPYKFPDNVINEATAIPEEIQQKDLAGREDFRNKVVFTIDPFDAKDFDDALSVEELENGNLSVGIHIADVSNYVKKRSALDKEAFIRGNSVYFVGKVIPMLPEQLSNNICSLVPDKDRLTYSVVAELTVRGKLVDYRIVKTVINSKRRFTYEEAQSIIESGKGDYANEVLKLNKLAQTLRKKRLREGSIDFSSVEVKFQLDDEGNPLEIIKKEVKDSNMMVEEFMLLANKIVAKHIAAPESGPVRPFIYRVHDLPDSEKVYDFAKFVKSLGYSFDPNAKARSNQFQQLMQSVKGTEEETVISELAIRSMAKAIYDINNIGHYGLGFKYYTHFTSPIRRYSDLIVHRLLDYYHASNGKQLYSAPQLEEISEHISDTERSAIEAERLSIKIKQIQYLKGHLGEEFHAIISGITHFGMFVKIVDNLAEGLIRLRDLEGDFYVYDEKKYSLIGRSTKKQFRLGDKVQVKLVRVDEDRSELDFIITG